MLFIPVKDIAGLPFGKWVAEHFSHSVRGHGAYWWCVCSCGNRRVVLYKSLKEGRSESCGHNKRMASGVASRNSLYRSYKRGAVKRGLLFNLDIEQFAMLTSMGCYCGSPPSSEHKNANRHYNGSYAYNGIDRLDNKIGYEMSNCVPCCSVCNFMKRGMGALEFMTHCSFIAERARGGF